MLDKIPHITLQTGISFFKSDGTSRLPNAPTRNTINSRNQEKKMKRILLTTLLIATSMTYAKGVIEDPAKIGLTVKSAGLELSEQAKAEIRDIRANNPLGQVNSDLSKNKKDFSHLDSAYEKLVSDIKNEASN